MKLEKYTISTIWLILCVLCTLDYLEQNVLNIFPFNLLKFFIQLKDNLKKVLVKT